MARPRLPNRKDLPDNCYLLKVGRQSYFRYKHPITKKFTSLGKDRAAALRAARLLNARLLSTPTAEALVAKVMAPRTPLSEYIKRFRDEILPARRSPKGKPLSDQTRVQYRVMLGRVEAELGVADLAGIGRLEISDFLNKQKPYYRNAIRSLLNDLFTHAVAEGHRDDNPVAGTLKAAQVVTRRRLEYDEFLTIRQHAEPWFQLALDLALITLQRREDIAALTTQDISDGYLWITQKKTGRRIRIRIGGSSLEPLLLPHGTAVGESGARALVRKRGKAVSPPMLTKEFRLLWAQHVGERDSSSPTFHEIRALGARRYEDAGRNPQTLLGHVDPRTTRWYLDRHKVQWVDVELA